MLAQERLREIAWETGQRYPIPYSTDNLILSMIHPRLGHVHWHIRQEAAETLRAQEGDTCRYAPLVIRLYDITDVIFDGYNAHRFIDLEVNGLTGSYYFGIDRPARNYLAEIGLRCSDGAYRALARSAAVFFDRDRPSGNYSLEGLFVGGALKRMFAVESLFDAPVYERMNRELAGIARREALSIAMLFINPWVGLDSPLGAFISQVAERLRKFGGEVQLFTLPPGKVQEHSADALLSVLDTLAGQVYEQLLATHRQQPFHLLHSHDWYSATVGLKAAKALQLPLLLSLHSTEHERAQGNITQPLAATIYERERTAVQSADLIIVPHSSTRQQLLNLYGAPSDQVVIVPDVLSVDTGGRPHDPAEVKRSFNLNPEAPLVLFAGEISHAAGADLLMDALPMVCRNQVTAQFVFAGEGPLKGELEARAWHAGIGHRCQFWGDVSRETFEALLLACEFVVIPARTWQDAGLAQLAIDCGRPVLTTHQAGIRCVVHGQNGLLTYDNPGSIIWGVQELLTNPLRGSMLRLVAKKQAAEGPSLENVTAQHYLYYEILLQRLQGASHV
jgi:glycosyltransferase involved in cell wall biosynthesis